jgi:hypothetical protein
MQQQDSSASVMDTSSEEEAGVCPPGIIIKHSAIAEFID